jgi:ureidoglycolate hydrolase
MQRELPSPFDKAPRYAVTIGDRLWHALYLPIARAADFAARIVGLLQQGRISVYLTYSFLTLLALLFFVR